jgi:acetoin:2,6-dichlorophenolindophenol oxidoreductase subunit alpha
MPDLGQTTADYSIGAWLKNVGDRVERGETLVEVETDKAIAPVEAYCAGFLRKILCPAGSMVTTGQPIAILASTANEPLDDAGLPTTPAAAAITSVPAVRIRPKAPPQKPAAPQSADAKATPAAAPQSLDLVAAHEMMLRIRQFEERVYYLFLEGGMPGTIHLYLGQEAIAAGVCANLGPADYVTSTHRAHGHALAKGMTAKAIMAELFGKATGCSAGMGGSMHVGDMRVGMVPSLAVVGAGIPIAAGLALAAKIRKTGQVAVCFFGDGAANEGTFHEGINMAAIWDLPVVFVCENNCYGASTHVSQVMRVANVADRAAAYGIPGVVADGNDVSAVHQATREAVTRARSGAGPTLLECKTYRYSGHSRSDPGNYRPKEEVARWKERDPLELSRRRLLAGGLIDEPGLAALEARVHDEIEQAVAYARSSPEPAPDQLQRHVYWERSE